MDERTLRNGTNLYSIIGIPPDYGYLSFSTNFIYEDGPLLLDFGNQNGILNGQLCVSIHLMISMQKM